MLSKLETFVTTLLKLHHSSLFTTMLSTAQTQRTISVWRSRLCSAFRTAVACAIVACATLNGPQPLRRHLAFPGLSYGVSILVVDEASLGEGMRKVSFVLYGTLQGVLPAILSLWVIGPAQFTLTITTLAVALSAFAVALPESTQAITKRVALNQIVLVYIFASRQGGQTAVWHPISVMVSTALGALASLLALLFPYPKLACCEVRKKSKLLCEIVSVKQKLLINALCAENNSSANASLSQAKSSTKSQGNLLRDIQLKQGGMQWERPHTIFSQTNLTTPSDRLQAIEMPLTGMEIALASQPSFPIKIVDQELKDHLLSLTEHISQTLQHSETSTVPKTEKEVLDKSLKPLQILFPTQQDIPAFFFLFCMKLLYNQLLHTPDQATCEENSNLIEEETANSGWKESFTIKNILSGWLVRRSRERIKIAVKCSLSMGLSMLFGVLYSKDSGYSAALTAANCITPWREATFMVANERAQGTVLGFIYGVLGCFISEKHTEFRFLLLLPWFLCTSFLRQSQMYRQAGWGSAISAAITILGMKRHGSPSEFAMARITETFIGLSCSILVELLVQPTRAATLAKLQLSQSLGTLCECIESMASCTSENKPLACLGKLKEKEKNLREQVNALGKYIEQSEVEPNFWFLPFPRACYRNLLESLSKMAELLLFWVYGMENIVRDSHMHGVAWKDLRQYIHGDLEHFNKMVGSSLKSFKEIIQIKSLASLEVELQRKGISNDIELGKLPNADGYRVLGADEEELEKTVGSFLQHAEKVISKIHVSEGEEELKSQMVLCLSAMGFCIAGLMKETREIEKGVKELVQWENPSRHINLIG